MRKLASVLVAAASLAAGAFVMPAAAAPIAGQGAVATSAAHMLPTAEVRYRHRAFAPRRRGPHVVYRTVYRTRYVYLRPHVRHRRIVRRYAPVYAAPIYDYGPAYVAPQVYPQAYYYDVPVYGGPAYVAPTVGPVFGGFGRGGFGRGVFGHGGFAHGGGGGHFRRR